MSKKARLGKAERQLRRDQWKQFRRVREEAIAANVASLSSGQAETSKGYGKDTVHRTMARNTGAHYRGGFDRAERGSYPFHPGGH